VLGPIVRTRSRMLSLTALPIGLVTQRHAFPIALTDVFPIGSAQSTPECLCALAHQQSCPKSRNAAC
jgi:hypothetical protein